MHTYAIAIGGSTVIAGKVASAQRVQHSAEKGEIEYTSLVTGESQSLEVSIPIVAISQKLLGNYSPIYQQFLGHSPRNIPKLLGYSTPINQQILGHSSRNLQ
jgi:hypothetical protein